LHQHFESTKNLSFPNILLHGLAIFLEDQLFSVSPHKGLDLIGQYIFHEVNITKYWKNQSTKDL